LTFSRLGVFLEKWLSSFVGRWDSNHETAMGLLPGLAKSWKVFPMRERQRERNGNGEARRASDRVVGPTKLLGSTTDTFLDSNHQDTMTTRSLASSPTSMTVGLITVLLLITVARKWSSRELTIKFRLTSLISKKKKKTKNVLYLST